MESLQEWASPARVSDRDYVSNKKYPGCNCHSCVKFLELEEKTDIIPDGKFIFRNMQVTRGISSLAVACKGREDLVGWKLKNVRQYFLQKVRHIIPDGKTVSLIE